MLFRIYNILLYIFSVFFFPFMAVRLALKGKSRAGIRQRFGFFPKGFFSRDGGKAIWVHAVSVGETLAAVPLVKALKERHPDLTVFFSTVTETGNAVAASNIGNISRVFYFPFDFIPVVRKVVSLAAPDCFTVVETEIWPNVIKALHDRGVPSVLVNGRISPRSYRGYSRARFFIRRVLEMIDAYNMQTNGDAERIKSLGAPSGRVRVAGNVKFDQACGSFKEGKEVLTKARLGIPENALVIVAGSTHEGEEAEVLTAYKRLLEDYPDAVLILAPRHPERVSRVEALIQKEGLKYRLRSMRRGERISGREVLLVDTMGELALLYRAGDIIFVGGSWNPVGGHNVLEPAAYGKPVFFGPHMHNFSEISAALRDCGVGIEVRDGLHLAREAARLLGEPERYETLGKLAKETLLRNRGALQKNLELIERRLYG